MQSARKNGVEYMPNNLIVNYLPQSMTQEEVRMTFCRIGPVTNCKLVKDHTTGISLGYGFIEFQTEADAQRAIAEMDGTTLQGKTIRVSHARPSSSEIKNANLYITGLPTHFDEARLGQLFSGFGTIITQKILYNSDGSSQGVGFVRFNKRAECDQAIAAMNGKLLAGMSVPLTVKYAIQPAVRNVNAGRGPMRPGGQPISAVTPMRGQFRYNPVARNPGVGALGAPPGHAAHQPVHPMYGAPAAAPSNQGLYCVYVANLQPSAGDLDLYKIFSPFGAIMTVKAICNDNEADRPCKGYGFVNFQQYEDAYNAICAVNGMTYEGTALQASFKTAKRPGGAPMPMQESTPMPYGGGLTGLEKQYVPF